MARLSYRMTCARAGHPVLGGMTSPAGYELIIDAGGNPALSRLRDAMTSTGTAVIAAKAKAKAKAVGGGREYAAS